MVSEMSADFELAPNHFYQTPSERLRETLEYGDRVFQLCHSLLVDAEYVAQNIAVTSLIQWSKDLVRQKEKSWKVKPYKGPPDMILLNRYHLLQNRVFGKLEEYEGDEERLYGGEIPPFVIVLRYVKAVLGLTMKKSEHRIIGMCHILRDHSFRDLVEIFDNMWCFGEAYRDIDEQYFRNASTKLFGSPQYPLRKRFDQFFDIENLEGFIQPFRQLESPLIISWVNDQLDNNLSPWGVTPTFTNRNIASDLPSPFTVLSNVDTKLLRKKPSLYSAADEIRMLLVTSPKQYGEFVNKAKIESRRLRLPAMKNSINNSQSLPIEPPVIKQWDDQNRLQAVHALQSNAHLCRKGWLADELAVRIKGNIISRKEIVNWANRVKCIKFNTNDSRYVAVELVTSTSEELLYEFEIDKQQLRDTGSFLDQYRGEGGQLLTLSVCIGSEDVQNFEASIGYSEPVHWKFYRKFRVWTSQLGSTSLYIKPILATAPILVAVLAVGLTLFNRESKRDVTSLPEPPNLGSLFKAVIEDAPAGYKEENEENEDASQIVNAVKNDNSNQPLSTQDSEVASNKSGKKSSSHKREMNYVATLGIPTIWQPVGKFQKNSANLRGISRVVAGQEYRINGTIVTNDHENIVVRDAIGSKKKFRIKPDTIIRSGNFWRREKITVASLIPGTEVEVDTLSDSEGIINATNVRLIPPRLSPEPLRMIPRIQQAFQQSENTRTEIDNRIRELEKREMEKYELRKSAVISFEKGKSQLSDYAKTQLDEIAEAAKDVRRYFILVVSPFTQQPMTDTERNLGNECATTIKNFLLDQHAIIRIDTPRDTKCESFEVRLMVRRNTDSQ